MSRTEITRSESVPRPPDLIPFAFLVTQETETAAKANATDTNVDAANLILTSSKKRKYFLPHCPPKIAIKPLPPEQRSKLQERVQLILGPLPNTGGLLGHFATDLSLN
jgi:hypothetical protein